GDAAISRRVPGSLTLPDQRVGQLVLAAEMDPELDRVLVHLTAIRPDAPDPRDRTLADGEGGIGIIAVVGRRRSALAAVARRRRIFLETGGPDERPGRAHRAVDA